MNSDYGKVSKITFEKLMERGYVETVRVGAANIVWSKWGMELETHADCVTVQVRGGRQRAYITYEHELDGFEIKYGVNDKPNINLMSKNELLGFLPKDYKYKEDKRKTRGRYSFFKGVQHVSASHYYENTFEDELHFIKRSILWILKHEKE